MQTGLNANMSLHVVDSFDIFNSTINTTSSFVEEKWSKEEIARWIHIIVRPILIVFGTIANFLSFYVMRRTSLKEVSSCFYMSLLALADTSKQNLRSVHTVRQRQRQKKWVAQDPMDLFILCGSGNGCGNGNAGNKFGTHSVWLRQRQIRLTLHYCTVAATIAAPV